MDCWLSKKKLMRKFKGKEMVVYWLDQRQNDMTMIRVLTIKFARWFDIRWAMHPVPMVHARRTHHRVMRRYFYYYYYVECLFVNRENGFSTTRTSTCFQLNIKMFEYIYIQNCKWLFCLNWIVCKFYTENAQKNKPVMYFSILLALTNSAIM